MLPFMQPVSGVLVRECPKPSVNSIRGLAVPTGGGASAGLREVHAVIQRFHQTRIDIGCEQALHLAFGMPYCPGDDPSRAAWMRVHSLEDPSLRYALHGRYLGVFQQMVEFGLR